MAESFYSTAAQVFPVLFLAIAIESQYLRLLKTRSPVGRRFWSLNRVRWFAIALCTWNVFCLAICLLVLAEWVPDSNVWRALVMIGLLTAFSTLLFRIFADVVEATTPNGSGSAAGSHGKGDH